MVELAAPPRPPDIIRRGFRVYERFRPEVPQGELGWGQRASWISEGTHARRLSQPTTRPMLGTPSCPGARPLFRGTPRPMVAT